MSIERITQGRPWAELGAGERAQVALHLLTSSAAGLYGLVLLVIAVGALWWFLL